MDNSGKADLAKVTILKTSPERNEEEGSSPI